MHEALEKIALLTRCDATSHGRCANSSNAAFRRARRVTKFPLLWCYFERGERQDAAAFLGAEFAGN